MKEVKLQKRDSTGYLSDLKIIMLRQSANMRNEKEINTTINLL